MHAHLGAQLAQLVEQWTENPRVRGSNPRLGTIYHPLLSRTFSQYLS
jgi:hypothetical protein